MARFPYRAVLVVFALAFVAVAIIDIGGLLLGDTAESGGAASVITNVVLKLTAELFLLGMLQLFVRWDWARRFSGQILNT